MRYESEDDFFYPKCVTFRLKGFREEKILLLGRGLYDVSDLANEGAGELMRRQSLGFRQI